MGVVVMLGLSMLEEKTFKKSSLRKGISKVDGKVRKPQDTPQLTKLATHLGTLVNLNPEFHYPYQSAHFYRDFPFSLL